MKKILPIPIGNFPLRVNHLALSPGCHVLLLAHFFSQSVCDMRLQAFVSIPRMDMGHA